MIIKFRKNNLFIQILSFYFTCLVFNGGLFYANQNLVVFLRLKVVFF